MKFIQGLELCESFFREAAQPVLRKEFPDLNYSAGLLGYGSDVLGYDDQVSSDHMWGPRFYLFLAREDMGKKEEIEEAFGRMLPYTYMGYSVNFSEPDPEDHGVRHPELIREGKVSPLIFVCCFPDFVKEYLGIENPEHVTEWDWLACSEHRLLGSDRDAEPGREPDGNHRRRAAEKTDQITVWMGG